MYVCVCMDTLSLLFFSPKPPGSIGANRSTKRKAGTANMGCGRLVNMAHSTGWFHIHMYIIAIFRSIYFKKFTLHVCMYVCTVCR